MMLIDAGKACLIMVDVQEKLVCAVEHSDEVINNCAWLMKLARQIDLPLLVSEQYPKGLGPSVDALLQYAKADDVLDKVHFSCAGDKTINDRVSDLNRQQILIAGIESHVCVLQTALGFKAQGKDVFVVVDAIASRSSQDHQVALSRMNHAGIQLVTKEMVFFECLRQAGTPQFKTLSKEFIK